MKRRAFLKKSALASTALWAPRFLQAWAGMPVENSRRGNNLVVVQLSGGNDGLNTVVPYRNDIYYRERPRLAISRSEVLTITDELGFHPALSPLRELWDEGWLSIVNNVGYPNPNRSHFRSMDIWHTASDSQEYLSTGWLGRYLDSSCAGCHQPHHAIEVDESLSLALKGEQQRGFAMRNPGRMKRAADNRFLRAVAETEAHAHESVAYLYKTLVNTQASADYLHQQAQHFRSKADYPADGFGRDLRQIAELIMADTDTQIYYVSLTGFDTHANQKGRQERLLAQYAEGMRAFVRDLDQHGLLDNTLILTFSEFGRRVGQNASGGTDHGTANNVFLMGGQLKKPGFLNEGPDLSRLDQGDLIYQVDFREIYATTLNRWLGADADVLLGRSFDGLPFV